MPVRVFFAAGAGWHMGLYTKDDYFSAWEAQPEHNWMAVARSGVTSRYWEADLRITALNTRAEYDGVARYKYDTLDLTVDLGLALYSLHRPAIRLRHGFHLGVWVVVNVNCKSGDKLACQTDQGREIPNVARYPSAEAHLIDVLIRLLDGMWLEISPANVGLLAVYSITLGLRWEGIRIR